MIAAEVAGWGAQIADSLRAGLGATWRWLVAFAIENPFVAVAAVYALVRAMGRTIDDGTLGLRYTLGRADKVLGTGFHPLIPFAQRVRTLPNRARSLDLPGQRVTSRDGLVYLVDANLIYRVTDIRKALIEIDDLELGMLQVLGLSVQEVLRELGRDELRASPELDRTIGERMARRLAAWGVAVERAGLVSLTPSPETLRLTQQHELVMNRRAELDRFERGGATRASALPLATRVSVPISRTRRARGREAAARRMLRHGQRLVRALRGTEQAGLRKRLALQELRGRGVVAQALRDARFATDAFDAPRAGKRPSAAAAKAARARAGGV